MNFLERENLLDHINAQIEKSKQNLSILKGGGKNKKKETLKNYIKNLIEYLENSKDKQKRKLVEHQIEKLEKYL
mgnify:CR=1 FL=1